jgi:hypothetical protein
MAKPKQKKQSLHFIPPEFFSDPEVPTYDFFEHRNLSDHGQLERLLDDLIFELENEDFLRWEAVIRKEHDLALSKAHKEALSELLSFNDDEEDNERILYIDELPRPSLPWHEIVKKIASHLIVEQFKTYESHFAVTTDGWPELVECLEEHGNDLSLPAGAKSPLEAIPEEIRHRLWLQYCFEALSGLGQPDVRGLEVPDTHYRIEQFTDRLRECKNSVRFLNLTLEKLLTTLLLPPNDAEIFVDLMLKKLGMRSAKDQLAEFL